MLHDQGHVRRKLLGPQRLAAMTIGTPVVLLGAHGSAWTSRKRTAPTIAP